MNTSRLTGLGLRFTDPEPPRCAAAPLLSAVPEHAQVVLVPMTCLDRRRVRRRLIAPDGRELRIACPTGTVLHPGFVLHETDGVAYVVSAAPEDVAVIHPRDLAQAVRVAHAIGNLHRDVYADGADLLALWDAPLELLLLRLDAPVTRTLRPFLGRPAWEHT